MPCHEIHVFLDSRDYVMTCGDLSCLVLSNVIGGRQSLSEYGSTLFEPGSALARLSFRR